LADNIHRIEPMTDAQPDENKLIAQRREKLARLRERGIAFPNDFRRNVMAGELHAQYGDKEPEELEAMQVRVRVAGRMMSRRIMGKSGFAHIQDMCGRIQLFVQRDGLPAEVYEDFKKEWDLGDILGAEGQLFKTRAGSSRCAATRSGCSPRPCVPCRWSRRPTARCSTPSATPSSGIASGIST
jgi:lysyl-tRNA synthetase, class II